MQINSAQLSQRRSCLLIVDGHAYAYRAFHAIRRGGNLNLTQALYFYNDGANSHIGTTAGNVEVDQGLQVPSGIDGTGEVVRNYTSVCTDECTPVSDRLAREGL